MRIAIISDIHANLDALTALSDVIAEADRVCCLGDLLGYYTQVNEVIDYVRDLDAICVLGNHDDFLLRGCPDSMPKAVRFGIELADRVLAPEHRRWLGDLPLSWGGRIDGRSLLLVHGSPWDPLADYLYGDNPRLDNLAEFSYDLIAFGQTHRPLLRTTRGPRLVNPGSVGQSRHAPARACMSLFDTTSGEVTAIERPYDPRNVITLARDQGAGDWIFKHLTASNTPGATP